MPAKPQPVRWTTEKAATEFGIDRRTLTKKLRVSDIEPGDDGKYSTAQIVRSLFDDIKHESARLKREQADKAALENAKSRGETVSTDVIFRAYEGIFIALRGTILASSLTDAEKSEMLANLRHDITEAEPAN